MLNQRIKSIGVIGAPLDLGAGHRGVDAGPAAFRIAGLIQAIEKLGITAIDYGNVVVPIREMCDIGEAKAKFLNAITEICIANYHKTLEVLQDGHIPLVLGGDHSIAIGTVAAISHHYHSQNQAIGVIWVDAHADMNTPTTTVSGNIHGMPLSTCLGMGDPKLVQLGHFSPKVDARNVAIIGLRDIDPAEKEVVRKSGVKAYTMTDIDEMGMSRVIQEAIDIASRGTAGIHLSFDFDGLDPEIAPGVGTAVPGGINYREAHLLMEKIAASGRLIGIEMVELNPIIDNKNKTAELGVQLIESALGKRTL